jgi:predicted enzyme related to lactoylglutathione lyase
MPEYCHGTPSWVELGTPDSGASARFYRDLFGWAAAPAPGAGTASDYQIFSQDGRPVAGLRAHPQGALGSGWTTYISVDDAEGTTRQVAAAGGRVLSEPTYVPDLGQMALLTDPGGAAFGVWRPWAFAGAELTNEPVSVCWHELLTRDIARVHAFYPQIFGWTRSSPSTEIAGQYTVWEKPAGTPVGGIMPMGPMFAPETAPYWSVCFAVADIEATVAKAPTLGARVPLAPIDRPTGRFAGLIDPHGAPFTVLQAT